LGRFFGKSFFVVLRGLGSNFVIFGGRLIEFCLFPFSLSKAEILLRAFLREKNPEYPDFFAGLFLRKPRRLREKVRSIRTFSPDFFSGNPGDSGKKCGDSRLSSEVCLGLFDCATALFLSLL
jgi:hypothetical protein